MLLRNITIFSISFWIAINTSQLSANDSDQGKEVKNVMNRLFQAISDRDLEAMAKTLSPEGNMQLILPASAPTKTNDEFIEYHRKWFAEPVQWTMTNEILSLELGSELADAVVLGTYREPERNGKPYFNKLIISYTLKKFDGVWYVVKDHATSIEKSEK